ncbi:PadR family transcriptional regulator [Schnuerera sp. xch1]|uniref:PadR family transcriptional regulator n=1 Tax=Schnuerera sp. xch1 TaxID=2874283 RepID=UPI001CBFD88F|nr:PadR family transcriptional regulator [Schnuerera sp. xch1]MBZ2175825.1 PadR family transcriptional regulator [Schnuerera sp. xch1]
MNRKVCHNGRNNGGGKILEACLLCLLKEKGMDYGYGLMTKLSTFGFNEENINIGTLYRCLRKLESQKIVESSWMDSDQGPKKRVYNITSQGEQELENLIGFLENRRSVIEHVLNYYEKTKE